MAYRSFDNTPYDKSLGGKHLAEGHLANSSTRYDNEAARSGFFTLQFAAGSFNNLIAITRQGTTAEVNGDDYKIKDEEGNVFTESQISEQISLNVIKFDEVLPSVAKMSFRRGNEEIKFAGVPTYDSATMVVDDMVGTNTKEILVAWLYAAYNPITKRGGRMRDYKKTATLIEYTQDFTAVRAWEIHGVFVTSLSSDGWDRENDSKKQISATLEYDWAEPIDIPARANQ